MEHRCPLAVYGCGFSQRRMFPGKNEGQTLIFSPAVESFGITRLAPVQCIFQKTNDKIGKNVKESTSNKESCTLIDLPFEILLDIIEYLDSFRLV